jgi:hypothetical protein
MRRGGEGRKNALCDPLCDQARHPLPHDHCKSGSGGGNKLCAFFFWSFSAAGHRFVCCPGFCKEDMFSSRTTHHPILQEDKLVRQPTVVGASLLVSLLFCVVEYGICAAVLEVTLVDGIFSNGGIVTSLKSTCTGVGELHTVLHSRPSPPSFCFSFFPPLSVILLPKRGRERKRKSMHRAEGGGRRRGGEGKVSINYNCISTAAIDTCSGVFDCSHAICCAWSLFHGDIDFHRRLHHPSLSHAGQADVTPRRPRRRGSNVGVRVAHRSSFRAGRTAIVGVAVRTPCARACDAGRHISLTSVGCTLAHDHS